MHKYLPLFVTNREVSLEISNMPAPISTEGSICGNIYRKYGYTVYKFKGDAVDQPSFPP